jgi:DNA mismatch endonuclease (patch repair protein)
MAQAIKLCRRVDPLSPQERSHRMSLIRAKDSKPEMKVRRLVHSMGFRYRLHVRELPGCPDMVFPARRKLVFVHGCFWHLHRCALCDRLPKTRPDYWLPKLRKNRERDGLNQRRLRVLGWRVLVIWECETAAKRLDDLAERLRQFLAS